MPACDPNRLYYLKFTKINWFISWTMFMWFCVSPSRGYLYFKEANPVYPDFEAEAVICIMTTIFGGLYFFWNCDQIRPDGVAVILAGLYTTFMLVNAIIYESTKSELPSVNGNAVVPWPGAYISRKIIIGFGHFCSRYIGIFLKIAKTLRNLKILTVFSKFHYRHYRYIGGRITPLYQR